MRSTVRQSSASWKSPSAGAPPAAGDVALGDVALAPAVMRGVDGQAERRVFVGDGARDVIVDPGGVAAHIKLEDAQARPARPGRRLRGPDRTPSDSMWATPNSASRLDHWRGALGMEAFQRADRAQHDRQPQLAAEDFGRGIDLAHVAQHARAERDRIERHAVAPQRRFGFDAADDVVPGVLVEVLPRLVDDLVQVHEVGAGRQLRQSGCFVEFFAAHRDTRRSLRPSGLEEGEPCGCKGEPPRYRAVGGESRNQLFGGGFTIPANCRRFDLSQAAHRLLD